MRKICVLMAGVGALSLLSIAAGCASEPTASTTSTITGTIQQETFPAPITAVKAGSVSAPVDTSGRFELVLAQGAVYQFALVQEGGEMPLVVRATASRFDTTAEIESGGATIDLGAVHFWDGASVSGSSAILPPVATEQAAVVCEGGATDDDDDDDGTEVDDDDDGTEADDDDGANAVPEVTDRQASDKMGLSEFNLPDDIECEGADDDDDDDDDGDDGAEDAD